MRGNAKPVLVGAFVLLLLPAVAAQAFSVDVSVDQPQVNPADEEAAVFNISVTNTGDVERLFALDYVVSNPGWYFLPTYQLWIDPGETRHAVLYATPDREAVAGNKGVLINVRSDGETVEKRAFFTVRQDRDVLITRLSTDRVSYRPGEQVNASLTVRNVQGRDIAENEYRIVFMLNGEEQVLGVPALDPGETTDLAAQFPLEPHVNGVQNLVARAESIEGVAETTRTANIRIETVERVDLDDGSQFNLFTTTHTVSADNTGNTAADDVAVSGAVPSYLSMFVSFDREPTRVAESAGTTTYTWNVGSLAPGDSVTITYQVNYWIPLGILLAVVAGVGFGVYRYTRPHIVKRVYRKDGTHAVHLRVENRSRGVIDDAVVRDAVPGIATLIEKFDAASPEKIRKGDEDTELEWRLGRMEPGEERVLTYTISQQIEVEGDVTLPAAELAYHRGEKQKQRRSGTATADFTQ